MLNLFNIIKKIEYNVFYNKNILKIKMSSDKLIHYETTSCKVKFRYKTLLQDDFEIDDLTEIEREQYYCYGTDQYIRNFIGLMKDKVIRQLPCLNKFDIQLGILDKNNMWHRFIITTIEMLSRILGIKRKLNYYKSIFVIIHYENNVVFTGNLNFEGIE